MNCILKITVFVALVLLLDAQGLAKAQMFAPVAANSKTQQYNAPKPSPVATKSKAQAAAPVKVNKPSNVVQSAPRASAVSSSGASSVAKKTQQKSTPAKKYKDTREKNNSGKFIVRFVGDKVIIDEEPAIFLYMTDFKISNNMQGYPQCSMKFFVNNTTNKKITNISYRLRWEDMETGVAFDNVEPNQPNFIAYTLLGKGCYNMDKAPNIVVNRCRIKGMSQKQCADIISWVK